MAWSIANCSPFQLVACGFAAVLGLVQPALAQDGHRAAAPLVLLSLDGAYALAAGTAVVHARPVPDHHADAEPMPRQLTDSLDRAAEPLLIEGPVWSVQRRARGPMLEVGALGGGQAWAPSLAHVAVGWHF